MAVRRGVGLVLVLIVAAIMISAAGLVMMAVFVGREPQIAGGSTLVLKISGDLQETEPGGVIGQIFDAAADRALARRGAAESQGRSADLERDHPPDRRRGALGQGPGDPRRGHGFPTSGKPVIAYLEYGGEQEFYLATACDKVFLMPSASLDLTGVASYELFLRGMLDKVGAYPDTLHIGEYKTASNTFTERTYTPAHLEMAQSLNADMYEQLVRGLADGRHKSEEEVRALIDHGPFLPEDAVRAGLVDDVAYEDELDDKVHLAPGPVKFLTEADYRRASPVSLGLNRGPRIALIYATGMIASGQSSYDSPSGQVIGADTLVEYLRKARADESIKAIVLRVDSPGGSAIASDVIWREMMLTRAVKPVIASMSDVAASGGYYIAMPAHAIVAEPATLTGSIGVVMLKFVIDGTLKKLGVNMERVTSGRYADLYSPVRAFTTEERAKVREQMQATYDTFVEKAADGRHTTPERIDAVGQGRVWTGRQAKEIGLVDELGGLDRALALAKQRAKMPAGQRGRAGRLSADGSRSTRS